MKALVYHGPLQMRWEEWPQSEAKPGEATVQILTIGICGSDVHGYTGESGRRQPPMIMGHEAVGVVIDVGAGVSPEWQGQKVIIQPFLACGNCNHCKSGQINLCRNRRFLGGNINGAMAETITLPLANLVPLPAELDVNHGVLTEPLAVAIHAAKMAGDLDGKTILVAGCGPIGLLTLIAIKQAGAAQVMMTDVIPTRLERARQLGADAALNPLTTDLPGVIREFSQTEYAEVDIAFDAVGVQATFQQVQDVTRPGGTVIALGGWQTVKLNLAPLVARELRIHGSFNFTPDEFQEAARLLASHVFDPACLVTDIHPLADGASVFEDLAQGPGDRIKTVLIGKEVLA